MKNKKSPADSYCATFQLSKSEEEKFKKSKSNRIMFELGGGIGHGVYYQDKSGRWVDITDASNW